MNVFKNFLKIGSAITKFKQSIFLKNTILLFCGTAVSQIIPVLATPLLTRLYAPDEFGSYALFLSVVSITSIVASLRFELAIMLPKKDVEAVNVFYLSLFVVFLFSAIFGLSVVLFDSRLISILRDPKNELGLKLAPIMVLLIGIQQCSYCWLSRTKKYKTLSIVLVLRSGIKVIFQLLLVKYFMQGATGLVLGALTGQICSSLFIIWKTLHDESFRLGKFEIQTLPYLFKKYVKFPAINSPHALVNTLAANLPILLLTRFYSSTVSGFYSLSFTIVLLPISFVSSAVSQVFFQRISKAFNSGEDMNLLARKMVKTLFVIAIFPFFLMLVFIPVIFSIVFGGEWGEAGVYARLLLPWIFMIFIVSPLSYIPIILGKQRKAFEIEVLGILLRLGGLYCGYYFNSPQLSVALFSFAGIPILLYSLVWILEISKQESN